MKLSEIIRATIEIGRRNGVVTFDERDERLPAGTTESEDIEVVMQALSDEGINVVDEQT